MMIQSIGTYNYNRKSSFKKNDNQVAFKGALEQRQLYEKLAKMSRDQLAPIFDKAAKSLPEINNSTSAKFKEVNKFFNSFAEVLQDSNNKEKSFLNLVGDAMGIEKNDTAARDFSDVQFINYLAKIEQNPSYKNFIEIVKNDGEDFSKGWPTFAKPVIENEISTPSAMSLGGRTTDDFFNEVNLMGQTENSKRFKDAIDKLPGLEDEYLPEKKKVNQFFRDLSDNVWKNSEKPLIENVADTLGLALNNEERMFADNTFNDMIKKIRPDKRYKKFIEALIGRGLNEAGVDPNAYVSVNAAKKLNNIADGVVQGADEIKLTSEERNIAFEKKQNEINSFYQNKIKGKVENLDSLVKSVVENEKKQKEISKDLIKAEKERSKVVSSSRFANAEKSRESALKKIRALGRKTGFSLDVDYSKALEKHLQEMPIRENFDSLKSFKMAQKKWTDRKIRLSRGKGFQETDMGQTLAQLRKLRAKITNTNKNFPSGEFISKKIAQIKRFLSAETFNSNDLEALNKSVSKPSEKRISLLEQEIKKLKESNSHLEKYVKSGKTGLLPIKPMNKELSLHEMKKPVIGDFDSIKKYNAEKRKWEREKSEIVSSQSKAKRFSPEAKAQKFEENQLLIEKYKQEIEQIKSQNISSPVEKNLQRILLEQREKVRKFNETVPVKKGQRGRKSTKTGKDRLEALLSFFEKKKSELSLDQKALKEIDQNISNLKETQNVLLENAKRDAAQLAEIEKTVNSLKKVSKKAQTKINKNEL